MGAENGRAVGNQTVERDSLVSEFPIPPGDWTHASHLIFRME